MVEQRLEGCPGKFLVRVWLDPWRMFNFGDQSTPSRFQEYTQSNSPFNYQPSVAAFEVDAMYLADPSANPNIAPLCFTPHTNTFHNDYSIEEIISQNSLIRKFGPHEVELGEVIGAGAYICVLFILSIYVLVCPSSFVSSCFLSFWDFGLIFRVFVFWSGKARWWSYFVPPKRIDIFGFPSSLSRWLPSHPAYWWPVPAVLRQFSPVFCLSRSDLFRILWSSTQGTIDEWPNRRSEEGLETTVQGQERRADLLPRNGNLKVSREGFLLTFCSKVSHNCIVALYGVALLSDNCFSMVMEFMSGGTLRSFIDKMPHAINNDRRLGIVRRIAEGISASVFKLTVPGMNYLHNWQPEPILHRDLSSVNILVCIYSGVIADLFYS